MSKNNGHDEDFIAEGFHIIDEKHLSKKAPKILWGNGYKKKTDTEKIEYLEELAYSYNHAVVLIQDERDQLNKLCILKEAQLTKMNEAVQQNGAMLQSEITKMNEQRQQFRTTISTLDAQIKELKGDLQWAKRL